MTLEICNTVSQMSQMSQNVHCRELFELASKEKSLTIEHCNHCEVRVLILIVDNKYIIKSLRYKPVSCLEQSSVSFENFACCFFFDYPGAKEKKMKNKRPNYKMSFYLKEQ